MYAYLVCRDELWCIGTSKGTTFCMVRYIMAWHCRVPRTVLITAPLECRWRCGNSRSPYWNSLGTDSLQGKTSLV